MVALMENGGKFEINYPYEPIIKPEELSSKIKLTGMI